MEKDARERLIKKLDTDKDIENELEDLLGYHPSTAQVNALEHESELKQDKKDPEETGKGVVQDWRGRFFGSTGNVVVWTDAHGNVMGHNRKTGERAKLVDAQ